MFIDDQAGVVNGVSDTSTVFDVKVVVAATDSRAALDAKVASMVNSANTLAIGVDPVHHYTFTHFGVGAGVPRDQYQEIARAGNGEFKQGHWGAGINAIIANATAARHEARSTNTTIVVPTQVTTVEHPIPVLPFVIGGAVLLLGFFLLWRWNKRRSAEVAKTLNDFQSEAQQMRSRNIEEQGWHDKFGEKVRRSKAARPAAPSQQPQVIVTGSNNDGMLTGLIIGESLASRRDPPARDYAPAPASHSESAWQGSSGSSSSSWDSGSSSSDSGSGGGDFGGGFDGGGGGGDF